jgi:hypothetical protein
LTVDLHKTPSVPLSETSASTPAESDTQPQPILLPNPNPAIILTGTGSTPYQRKVRLTMTRTQAELARALFMRASVDEDLAARLAPYRHTRRTMRIAKAMWRYADKKIETRDRTMREKMHLREAATKEAEDGFVDRPFVELEE